MADPEALKCDVAYALRQLKLARLNAHRYYILLDCVNRAIEALERIEEKLESELNTAGAG